MSCPGAKVKNRIVLERDSWRVALYGVDIMQDMPCTLMVYNPEVLDEVLGSEEKREVVRSVLGCKGTSNESVNEEVTGPRPEDLRKKSQLKKISH